jgi:hypothetical protein
MYLTIACEPVGGIAGDRSASLGGEVSARSFDAMIEMLVQVRDRARMDGVLAAS